MLSLEVGIAWAARAHQAGTNSRYDDSVFPQLCVKTFRETNECKFARAVRHEMRHGDLSADRRNIHDASVTSLTHFGQDREDRIEWTPEVRAHSVFEIFVLHYFEWSNLDRAGVVNQHVNLPKALAYSTHHVFDLRNVRDVAFDCQHVRAAA